MSLGRLTELNSLLTCILCGGYLVDATAITECLHSFCRACIVRYLENNGSCPVCEVSINRAKPHKVIRPDKTLQTLAYKMVPGLFPNEMKRRVDFYSSHKQHASKTTLDDKGEGHTNLFDPSDPISLCLAYDLGDAPDNGQVPNKRYFNIPGAFTINQFRKFLRLKYNVPANFTVNLWGTKEVLTDDLTFLDVVYIEDWQRKEPLVINFRFSPKLVKLKSKTKETPLEVDPLPDSVPAAKERPGEPMDTAEIDDSNEEGTLQILETPEDTSEELSSQSLPTKVVIPDSEVDSGHESPGSNLDKSPLIRPHSPKPDSNSPTPPTVVTTTETAKVIPRVSVPSAQPQRSSDPQSDVLDLTVHKAPQREEDLRYARKRPPVPNPPVLNRHRLPQLVQRHPSFTLLPPAYRHPSPFNCQPFLHQPHRLPKRSKTTPMPPMNYYPELSSQLKVPQLHHHHHPNRVSSAKNDHHNKLYSREPKNNNSHPTPVPKMVSSPSTTNKGYSRFKGSNLMAFNPDPTSSHPKLVIKNMCPRPH